MKMTTINGSEVEMEGVCELELHIWHVAGAMNLENLRLEMRQYRVWTFYNRIDWDQHVLAMGGQDVQCQLPIITIPTCQIVVAHTRCVPICSEVIVLLSPGKTKMPENGMILHIHVEDFYRYEMCHGCGRGSIQRKEEKSKMWLMNPGKEIKAVYVCENR